MWILGFSALVVCVCVCLCECVCRVYIYICVSVCVTILLTVFFRFLFWNVVYVYTIVVSISHWLVGWWCCWCFCYGWWWFNCSRLAHVLRVRVGKSWKIISQRHFFFLFFAWFSRLSRLLVFCNLHCNLSQNHLNFIEF